MSTYFLHTAVSSEASTMLWKRAWKDRVRNESRAGKKMTRPPSEPRVGRSRLPPGIVQSSAQCLLGPISVGPPSALEGQGGHYCPCWSLIRAGEHCGFSSKGSDSLLSWSEHLAPRRLLIQWLSAEWPEDRVRCKSAGFLQQSVPTALMVWIIL